MRQHEFGSYVSASLNRKESSMGTFLRNILIGVGIALLIAPKRGEEMRQTLMERYQQLRGSLSGNSQPPISDRSSEQARVLESIAEQAERHPSLPTSPPFSPAYPEYVNPEKNPDQ